MTRNPNVLNTVISPRRYRVRVRVYRAGEWVDITSRVASGTIRESNDQPVATLELLLLNGRQYPSLAPRRKDSPLNQVNGQYVPLLWIGRLIAVEAAFSEDGSEPDEWWPVFLGELEDEIDTESGPDGMYVRLFCRDMATRLQRAYIAGPWSFENMYASQMIQAILDHAYSEGLIQEPVQLRLIGPDDFWVERYDIEYTDLWSALQRFCQQRGTDLRYRLNEDTGQIELTYWLPDRAMVPGWTIDASQIYREDLRISGTDIINRVTVRYRDASTGQRAEVTVQDEDSIAMYGLRHGLIEEPDTDLIPDEATAQALAQTIVEDLKDVPALTRITCPFDPRIQLFDKLRVTNPSVRDEPEDYAIEARELSFSSTDWSMVLTGGSRVVVKRTTWLERLATEGVKQPFTPGDWITNSRPPEVVVTLSTGLEEVEQGTTAYIKASWQRPDWRYIDRYVVRIRRLDTDEYQYQETAETSATFYGLLANVSYGVQVATIDGRGTVGEWSTEATITTPKDETIPAKPTGLVAVPVVRGFVLTWDHYSPPPPLSHWIVERASSADEFQTWTVVNREVRSALYTDQDPALDRDLEYKYRVIAVSRTGIHSAPSDPTPPSKPGKVSLAEDVVDQLKREYLEQDFVNEVQDMQSRLGQAESGLQEAQNRLSGAEQRLDDAADRLSNAETRLTEAEDRLGAAEQRLTTAEAELAVHADEIQARVKQEDFDVLEGRVTQAESTLTIHADQIATKVEQSVVDALEGRVSQAETAIQQKADRIELTALSQEVDTIEQRVTTAETTLTQKADKIELNAVRQDLDQLSGTVATHEATLQTHAQQIAARVTQEVFNVLEGRVTQAEAELNILADEIQARVEKTVFDTLAQTVAEHSATLEIHADEIAARVKQTVFDTLEQRVTDAETTLQAHAGEIAARVTQTTFDALKRVVDSRPKTKPQGGILFPFDTTLFGTGGIKPLDGYVATLRPGEGRFGGALAVEVATTNLWTNPGWLNGSLTGWEAYSTSNATGSREVVKNDRFGYALRLTKTDSGGGRWGIRQGKTWYPGGSHIADSIYVKVLSASSGATLKLYSDYRNVDGANRNGRGFTLNLSTMSISEGSGGATHLSMTPAGDGWYRIEYVTPESDIVSGSSYYWIDGNAADILLAHSQKEAKKFCTSFVNGTRNAAVPSFPVTFNDKQGTVAWWMAANPEVGTADRAVLRMAGTSTRNDIWQTTGPSGNVRWWNNAVWLNVYTNISPRAWLFVVATWNKNTGVRKLYVYNAETGILASNSDNRASSCTFTDTLWLGYGTSYLSSVLYDELLILPYEASEEEIRSWYETQAPFYDPDDVAYTAGRVEQHEATLQIHAGQIASKVERTEFDQLSDRVTQAETTIQQKADQVVVTAIDNRLQTAEQDISSLVVTAQEISTAVANVQDGLTQAQSAIQQNANQIALRVQAINQETGEPVQAALQVFVQDGEPYVLLDGRKVLLPGTLVADDIQSGTLRLTGDMAIDGPGGSLRIGDVGGKPWGYDPSTNQPVSLAPGTFGIWGEKAGIFLQGYLRVLSVKPLTVYQVFQGRSLLKGQIVDLIQVQQQIPSQEPIEVLPGRMVAGLLIPRGDDPASIGGLTKWALHSWRALVIADKVGGGSVSDLFVGPGSYDNWRVWVEKRMIMLEDEYVSTGLASMLFWFVLVEMDAEDESTPIRR